eukprot:Em0019g821a
MATSSSALYRLIRPSCPVESMFLSVKLVLIMQRSASRLSSCINHLIVAFVLSYLHLRPAASSSSDIFSSVSLRPHLFSLTDQPLSLSSQHRLRHLTHSHSFLRPAFVLIQETFSLKEISDC